MHSQRKINGLYMYMSNKAPINDSALGIMYPYKTSEAADYIKVHDINSCKIAYISKSQNAIKTQTHYKTFDVAKGYL